MNTARIKELLDEKEYPIAANSPIGRYALELRNAIGPLLDRVERLEADARRYQWLRGQNCIDWDAFTFADGYEHPDSALDSYELMLDAAIDAALRGKGDLVDQVKFIATRTIQGESGWPVEQRVNAVEVSFAKEQAATIDALREEVSRLTENQRQQDSATAFVMERDEKERDALRKEVEEYKSEYFRVHNLKMDAIEARLAAERELAACKENAERYRWLRDCDTEDIPTMGGELMAREALDEHIDAAIKAARKV